MPQISKITLPSGSTYDLKDSKARQDIETIKTAVSGGVSFLGITTTVITDGSETSSIVVDGKTISAINGGMVIYGDDEFIWADSDSKWHRFGPAGTFRALAFKDSASGSYTPEGTVSQPTFTGSSSNVTIIATDNTNGNYQPKGTVSKPTFNGSSSTFTGKFTPTGDVTVTTGTTTNKTTTVSATTGEATYTPGGSVSQPTFTGSNLTSTGTFTPEGSIGFTNTNKTTTVSKAASGEATYTPQGSVAAPTISVKTAGSTATVKNPTSVTVAKTVVAAAPGATAPANSLTYYAVAGETLSLYQLGYTTGASITTADVTVKTGDAAYQATAPAFTGTGARLVTGNISVPSSASFIGTEGSVSVSGVPSGTVSQPTFTGTGARLVTGNIAVPNTFSATFTGTEGDVSTSGTPNGSVSQPTFTGSKAQLSGTTTANGSVSQPTFEGTQATITVS